MSEELAVVAKKNLGFVRLAKSETGFTVSLGTQPDQQHQFPNISAAARWCYLQQVGCTDAADYRAKTGRALPGVSWRYFGLKQNPQAKPARRGRRPKSSTETKISKKGARRLKRVEHVRNPDASTTASTATPEPTDLSQWVPLPWKKGFAGKVPVTAGSLLRWVQRDGAYMAELQPNGNWKVLNPKGVIEHADPEYLGSQHLRFGRIGTIFAFEAKSRKRKTNQPAPRKPTRRKSTKS